MRGLVNGRIGAGDQDYALQAKISNFGANAAAYIFRHVFGDLRRQCKQIVSLFVNR